LPEAIAVRVNSGQLSPQKAIAEWAQIATAAGEGSPQAHLLGKVKELAEAIATHGLINPISIYPRHDDDPVDVEYRIVTGERRWWAHVYLAANGRYIQEGNERCSPTQIKATLTPEGAGIRAHQLVENWFREDISIVEKAYGLWALRCEMSNLPFGDYDEREMVNWQEVEATLKIGRRQRRRIVSVLELSEEAQGVINGHRLSERSVRPIVAKLGDHPPLQLEILNQLIIWNVAGEGYGEKQVSALVDTLLRRQSGQKSIGASVAVPQPFETKKFRSRIRSTLKLVADLGTADWGGVANAVAVDDDLVSELRQLRAVIDQILIE
jgi:ParB-like chromosome segregation protein Spo0J